MPNELLRHLGRLVRRSPRMKKIPVPQQIKSMTMIAALLAWSLCGGTSPAIAQSVQKQSWPEVKCARYKKAWADAIAYRGTKGLSAEFLERHEAFLTSGCMARADVCPRSEEELYMVDMMVAAVVNAGIAGTFLPFICRD